VDKFLVSPFLVECVDLPQSAPPEQLGARHLGAYQYRLAGLIYAVDRENVLGEVNSNGYDSDDFPSQVS